MRFSSSTSKNFNFFTIRSSPTTKLTFLSQTSASLETFFPVSKLLLTSSVPSSCFLKAAVPWSSPVPFSSHSSPISKGSGDLYSVSHSVKIGLTASLLGGTTGKLPIDLRSSVLNASARVDEGVLITNQPPLRSIHASSV